MDFLKRHRSKFTWVAGLTGGAWLLGQYAKRQLLSAHEAMSRDRAAQDRLQRRFERHQADCGFMIMSLLPELAHELFQDLDVERLVLELQSTSGRPYQPTNSSEKNEQKIEPISPIDIKSDLLPKKSTPSRSKSELWHELKLITFTRLYTTLYSIALLTLWTRIQLNLIGRLQYMECNLMSKEDAPSSSAMGNPIQLLSPISEQRFLTFAWFFVHKGLKSLIQVILPIVESEFDQLPLKTPFSAEEMRELERRVRQRIEDAIVLQGLSTFILPKEEDEGEILQSGGCKDAPLGPVEVTWDKSLRELTDSARDILAAPSLMHVVHAAVDVVFSRSFHTCFPENQGKSKKPLASLLPIAKGIANDILLSVPNQFVAVCS
jgi:peroxin-3